MDATSEKTQQINDLPKLPSPDGDSLGVNGPRTYSKSDTPLTQCGSRHVPLPDCPRHLIRLRPSYGSKQRRFISDLAEQCKNYEAGNAHLARRMLETIDLIQSK